MRGGGRQGRRIKVDLGEFGYVVYLLLLLDYRYIFILLKADV